MTGWAISHCTDFLVVRRRHASIAPSQDCITPCFNGSFSQQSTDFRNSIRNVHIQIISLQLFMAYLFSSFINVKSPWKSWMSLFFKYTVLTFSFIFLTHYTVATYIWPTMYLSILVEIDWWYEENLNKSSSKKICIMYQYSILFEAYLSGLPVCCHEPGASLVWCVRRQHSRAWQHQHQQRQQWRHKQPHPDWCHAQ